MTIIWGFRLIDKLFKKVDTNSLQLCNKPKLLNFSFFQGYLNTFN